MPQIGEKESISLQLIECEYDCSLCGITHRYTEGIVFDLHRDLRIGHARWVYKEIGDVE